MTIDLPLPILSTIQIYSTIIPMILDILILGGQLLAKKRQKIFTTTQTIVGILPLVKK